MHRRNFWKSFYTLTGWCSLGIGIVGLVLPVMPGTVFLIIALACFARSNERLEKWLLEHPRLGPPLKQWRNSRHIDWKVKALALTTTGLSTLAIIFLLSGYLWLKVMLGIVVVSTCVYLLRLPGRSPANKITPEAPTIE